MKLQTNNIEISPRLQVRASTDSATVNRYGEAIRSGAKLPLIVVFREKGTERYVVADGVHRLEAAKRVGKTTLEVDLREGDETAALEFALGCNAEHGLQRTPKDLERAVGLLMSNPLLKAKHRTHEERAALLRIGMSTFQRHLATWRESDGGTVRERKAKDEARDTAAKHAHGLERKTNGVNNLDARTSQVGGSRAKPEPRSPALQAVHVQRPAFQVDLRPAQRSVRPTREQSTREHTAKVSRPVGAAAARALPHVEVHNFRHGLALIAASPLDMAALAASGDVPWAAVENAADKLRALLENR